MTDVFIYSPVLSLFMLPIARARNLPQAEDRAPEEEYRAGGRALYQLAQGINNPTIPPYENSPATKMRIQSVTQAAMVGLYATQALAPPAVDNSRAGRVSGRGADNPALAYPPADITAGTSSNHHHGNIDPQPNLSKRNNTEVSFNLMYLPDNEYSAYKGTRFFAVPIYKNRQAAPSLLPPEVKPQQPINKKNHNGISFQFFTVPHEEYPHYPAPLLFARPIYKKPQSVPALLPPDAPMAKPSPNPHREASSRLATQRNPVSDIPYQPQVSEGTEKIPAAITQDESTIEQRPGRQDPSPGLDSSGRAAKQDTVQLSAVDEHPAPASLESPVSGQWQDPGGKVAERPLPEEFIAPRPILAVIGGSAVLAGTVAAAGHAQEAVRFTGAGAGLSARVWPDAPARSIENIIDQCKIKLAANEEGVLKPYVDSDYYGQAPIYELVAKDAAFSQPVYRHYIEIYGEKAAVKLTSTKAHGIKYAMIDESKPDIQYALSFNDDGWRLQTPTAEEIDPSLLDAIRSDMIDPHCTEHMLSAPDERGLQWTKDQKSYLRIKERFVGVSPSKDYINCYEIRSQDRLHVLSLHYKDGLFRQLSVQPQELVKYGQQNTFLKQKIKIKKLLDKAKQDIANDRILKIAHHINKAFQEHRQYEAGSIRQLKQLAIDFIKKCVFRDEKVNLATAEITAIQEAWVKNIRLPLKTNTKVDVDDIDELFVETPIFCKKIINYLHPSESKNIFKKFASALDELSTTPMPHYGENPKTLHYNLVLQGTRTATKIAISGNEFFISLVTNVLNGIKQTPLGQKILLALREKAFTIHPPTMSAIERVKDGIFYAKNSAGGAIAFDPGNFIIGDGTTLKAEPWRNRDPAIALYHELLHIYYNTHPAKFRPVGEATAIKGTSITKTADKTAEITIAGGESELEEALITGISFRDPITKELYDFKKNEYIIGNGQDPISENHFRKEYAIMRGSDHYFIRPYYVKPNDMTDKVIKLFLTYDKKNKI
ncbi:hypothetical protein EZJ58_1071 [Sodalis ligni]|uniref:NleD-like pathogen effector protein (Putative zinc metallopeptidase) n=2 Tax=Sodalis ligni TaxID=2697027 RepID=A0A4R1NFX4_9GAMM|nr:hypothetical protein EZJ58_1071 [Sodalis ligni]